MLTPFLLMAVTAALPLRETDVALTLLVPDDAAAADQMVAAAQQSGGYFRERAAHHVVARVPTDRLEAYLKSVTAAGKLVERKVTARDVTAERAETAAGLASREQMLDRYFANMGQTANREDLGTLKAATSELVAEIERAKGTLRLMDHNTAFANVDISFRVREREKVKMDHHDSPFPWLGTVDLNSLLADFARDRSSP